MKRSVWSCLMLVTALGCGSDDRSGSPFGSGGGVLGGGAGGSVSGGSLAGGGGSPGGSGSCGSQAVKSDRLTADILIVLDRSGSMQMNGVNRWDPSVRGIETITSGLEDRVSFALMTFPGERARGGGQAVDQGCEPGTVNAPFPATADAISTALRRMEPGGYTPTAATLRQAGVTLSGSLDPDSRPVPKYVLLVTDGAPNCRNGSSDGIGGGGTASSSQPEEVEASVAAVQELTKAGVKTYVMGYDTQNDAALRTTLDRMASAGGTGEQQHRAIGDEASLVAAFREITGGAITCDFELENEVVDAKYVLVRIDGKQVNWKDANGWVLGNDNKTITLVGSACETIKEAGHTFAVSVECEPVPIVY